MDEVREVIQKLVDEARPVVARWRQEGDSWSWTMGWIVDMVIALEAALPSLMKNGETE